MDFLLDRLPFGIPLSVQLLIVATIAYIVHQIWFTNRPYPGFPIHSVDGLSPKQSWIKEGRKTLESGLETYPGVFQIITGTGPKLVLPNKYMDELKNRSDLNFEKAFIKDFFVNYPGFDGFQHSLSGSTITKDTVRVKLTQSLNLITDDLVDETTASVHDILGEDQEWHVVRMKDHTIDLVARLSARVFLGLPLCRDPRWLEISKTYTIDAFIASFLLRATPAFTRPFVQYFIPHMKNLRRAVRDAHRLIDPEVETRKERVKKAHEAGTKPPKTADTIGWMYELSGGEELNYTALQLSLSLAAIHTTSEATSTAILHCCQYPEVVDQLREEIIRVVGETGWSKNTLYKLRLMDSFLKESVRMNPSARATMNRFVEKDITLSDGTILPKGALIKIGTKFHDPEVYPEPDKFDAARFLRKREEPGQENQWQLATTSPEFTIFGHGQHACPGRFFAANEIKVLLCHLLLKYDFRLATGETARWNKIDTGDSADPNVKIEIRRRREEINIDLPLKA